MGTELENSAEYSAGGDEGSGEGDFINNFWDVGNYKSCIKRMEHAISNYELQAQLLKERAQVESAYSLGLNRWAEKWSKTMAIEKYGEYGTLGAGFTELLKQASDSGAIHSKIEQDLLRLANEDLPEHKKNEYKKEFLGYKEVKTVEKGFQKAQKPWAVYKAKVDKHKKNYFVACETSSKLSNLLKQAEGDRNFTEEERAKIRDKLSKAQKDEEMAKAKYEKAINNITADNERYVRDMSAVYEICEAKELSRVEFIKGVLGKAHVILQDLVSPRNFEILDHLEKVINSIDAAEDAANYSRERGKDSAMQWPQFEIWGGGDSTVACHVDHDALGEFEDASDTNLSGAVHQSPYITHQTVEDHWAMPPPEPANGSSIVRALYDYDAQRDDELSFAEGDVIKIVQGDDGSGWCTGMLKGRTGLLPTNYVG